MAPAAASAGKKQKKKWSKGKGTIHTPSPSPPAILAHQHTLSPLKKDKKKTPLYLKPPADPYVSSPTVKDKANHAVVLDKATSDKLNKDVQSYRLITVAVLVDRLKINGSLARAALNDLEKRGVIKKIVGHHALSIYTREVTAAE